MIGKYVGALGRGDVPLTHRHPSLTHMNLVQAFIPDMPWTRYNDHNAKWPRG